MRRLLLLAALLPLIIAAKPAAASTVILLPNTAQRSDPIEQESPQYVGGNCCNPETWVHYADVRCAWDVDDYDITEQIVDVAGPVEAPLCVIADGYDNVGGDDHRIRAWVQSPKPNVSVTLTNDQGQSWNVPITDSQKNGQTTWRLCFYDTTGYPNPVDWYPVIPGTNGGTGIPVTYTLHVSPTGRIARGVFVHFEDGSDGDTQWLCP